VTTLETFYETINIELHLKSAFYMDLGIQGWCIYVFTGSRLGFQYSIFNIQPASRSGKYAIE